MRKQLMKYGRTYAYVTAEDRTRRRTLAYKTVSEHFAITPLLYISDNGKSKWDKRYFAITHLSTGAAALKHFTSVRKAQKIAAIMAACPMDWRTVSIRNMTIRWKKMPEPIRRWRSEMSQSLFLTYLDRAVLRLR